MTPRANEHENTPDPSLATSPLDAETAARYRVAPLPDGSFAVEDPSDVEALDALRFLLGADARFTAASPESITAALRRDAADEEEIVPEVQDEPTIQRVNELIRNAFDLGASDIHLEPRADRLRVRYRVDGALRDMPSPPHDLRAAIISRVKLMASLDIAEKRLPQDGRLRARLADRAIDLRVSTIPTHHGESVVARLLDTRDLSLGLPRLGFEPDDQAWFEETISRPDGLVLITGPTGSGKTTTLYACLSHLNQPDRKIITVEDPVEYQLAGVNQTRVRPNIGLTFAAALRAIMRQAPNIIMIGEIRDRETAEIAINAALTGHMVLSTLHTNDAPSAATRLSDIGVKPFLTASALRGALAQRLVRRVCAECARERASTDIERRLAPEIRTTREGVGCAACGGTGHRGRVGIFERMRVDDRIRDLIHAGGSTEELRAAARASGARSLRQDALRKVAAGWTTFREAARVTTDEVSR